jgi:DNA-binding transcriptional regulator YdaS (Cro superfamily)
MIQSISSRRIRSKSVTFSKAVIRATKQLGLSQVKLADVLGVSPATVSRLFSGKCLLTPKICPSVAKDIRPMQEQDDHKS